MIIGDNMLTIPEVSKVTGKSINTIIKDLLNAYNPDIIEQTARDKYRIGKKNEPNEEQLKEARILLKEEAASSFNGEFITYIESLFYLNHEAVGRVLPILSTVAMRAFKKRLYLHCGYLDPESRSLAGHFPSENCTLRPK